MFSSYGVYFNGIGSGFFKHTNIVVWRNNFFKNMRDWFCMMHCKVKCTLGREINYACNENSRNKQHAESNLLVEENSILVVIRLSTLHVFALLKQINNISKCTI